MHTGLLSLLRPTETALTWNCFGDSAHGAGRTRFRAGQSTADTGSALPDLWLWAGCPSLLSHKGKETSFTPTKLFQRQNLQVEHRAWYVTEPALTNSTCVRPRDGTRPPPVCSSPSELCPPRPGLPLLEHTQPLHDPCTQFQSPRSSSRDDELFPHYFVTPPHQKATLFDLKYTIIV